VPARITSFDGSSATRKLEPVTLEAAIAAAGVIATVIAVAVLAAGLPAAQRPPPPRARPPSMALPTQLLRIERIVARSGESALAAHAQLRPLLSDIAEARLARRGIQLSRDHDESRQLLGPEAWELVRPDRPRPPERGATGVAARDLEAVVKRLEAL
jgi:hypothetical protein